MANFATVTDVQATFSPLSATQNNFATLTDVQTTFAPLRAGDYVVDYPPITYLMKGTYLGAPYYWRAPWQVDNGGSYTGLAPGAVTNIVCYGRIQ